MRAFHSIVAICLFVVLLPACAGSGTGKPGQSAGRRVPAPPPDCLPQAGASSYWASLETGPTGPRMAELIVKHPAGVVPEVTALESARVAGKQLLIREKGTERTRIILLSSNNTTTIHDGPLACVRLPAGSSAELLHDESSFAPASVFPRPETIALYPSEVSP